MRFPELDAARLTVAESLMAAMELPEGDVAKLLGVKGVALAAARQANRIVLTSGTKPALDRYTGVLYDALDHESLSSAAKRRANRQVIIFSALWGLVTPADPIPDYKLKMGAALPATGRLSLWWRPAITAALDPIVARKVVWDLLPNEHASAWAPAPDLMKARISVRFIDDVADGAGRKQITVAHWNKLLKGALVRHILETQLTSPDGLVDFVHPEGYVYDPALTIRTGDRTEISLVSRR